MLLFNVPTHFQQTRNIQKMVYDTETEETSYIRERSELPLTKSNTLTEETLSSTNGNVFHLFFWGTRVSPGDTLGALTRTALLTASPHFFACPFAGLPGHGRALAGPHPSLPASVTGPGAATPMTPRIPLPIGWKKHATTVNGNSTGLTAVGVQKCEDHNCSVFINLPPQI